MPRIHLWLRYALSLFWAVAIVLFPLPADRVEREAAVTPKEGLYKAAITEAPFGLLGVRFYESQSGTKRWRIDSTSAELHRSENYAFLKAVNAEFYAGRTGNRILARSQYGRSRLDRQEVDLEGDVQIESRRGYLFELEKMHYEGKSHEMSSNDFVRMKGPSVNRPEMILQGVGFFGNIDAEHFMIHKNVSAERRLRSSEWLRVNSRAGQFFTEEQRAVFVGKVRASLPKVTIESNLLELGIGREKESLLAKGNVILRQKTSLGTAESAFLETGSSRIILEGNAQVDSKKNKIRGRRIVLFTDEDRIEVEGAEGRISQ